ncbi:efflux RND transporter periplasmic adaptor subunit [Thermoflavifilum thermophilum]|uniref:Membrane fusion protein, cobalt-zinc-cadmium efflux system n=1 Tax=Thermoflavifilum thermophilum TaxID=1393122 RepID=A0A1I7N987_9BACT|nr:efflux RND transporter periplasmic adaptor subunit [Thermoflavifilum thermophilum]SFV31264.1 membrane fusion protein, cobalt-zinc-cadmium efflux system [Thermoflavifilum thermophilum]
MKKLIFVVLIAWTSCSSPSRPSTQSEAIAANEQDSVVTMSDVELQNAGIQLVHPEIRDIYTQVKLNGQIDVPPQNLISISSPVGGFLKYTHLLPGDHVKKGEVIAELQDMQYIQMQQDYLTAKTRLAFLQQELNRQQALSENQATSQKNYQQILSEYQAQQIQFHALAAKLRLMGIEPDSLTPDKLSSIIRLRSPINGYVASVNVNIGKYVMPTDVLFQLVDPRDIHAAMTVFQEDIDLFKPGIRGKVYLPNQPGKFYDVEVVLITRNVDSNRAGLLHCHFLQDASGLLPGMYVSGNFTLGHERSVAVPDHAVVHYQGKDYVFVAHDNHTFVLTPVRTGKADSGWIALPDVKPEQWLRLQVAAGNAFAILGKMKNRIED